MMGLIVDIDHDPMHLGSSYESVILSVINDHTHAKCKVSIVNFKKWSSLNQWSSLFCMSDENDISNPELLQQIAALTISPAPEQSTMLEPLWGV
jgi:hypothetical protein